MPQLDTSTWFITIISSMITLFILFQLKVSSQTFPLAPSPKSLTTMKVKTPWELKWTKIYLPHSLPQQ
ncbi:ATP synthase F0 subunit 8 (mitochondrion) [Mus musculus]|uniref:ATP synthase F(0) complex subunit 8 n=5 Tax=Mus musculus TaxID=10090 RepID=ATP8_MOUSE|nr:ATP synthase F0 subunit 8 [Mus musculus]YP_002791046.1 ATP synthase F0 subunit 8 [Mus musculus castaneus]YP_220554.1 ATP synthase F0 subunit 8 [Mus musculus domesticus]P03930.1 RecName: Full=ATP synthase protein 8; AltName: Full=A6L; AltName: Full=F-ATPase subunit 8 [Mus musculus]AKC99163.1 ATP synthase F0 subunit 8 [Mus musculus helgolandicus]WPW52377.1 ATP synthase F0 subunit 8 [Mus musculus musculus]WPW52806.1 ATP synthase F0 subunit 8 [Mus spretus]AAB48648.1 protein A61 [Mus musculus]|eukprot:NP_904332.1 ATP synthase F0 subunit 8 (mitochondrion) [Mus musculus]